VDLSGDFLFKRSIPGADFQIEVGRLVRFLFSVVLFVVSCCLSNKVHPHVFLISDFGSQFCLLPPGLIDLLTSVECVCRNLKPNMFFMGFPFHF
jgi:hypothetical protein